MPTTSITAADLAHLAPSIQPVYHQAFMDGQPVLDRFGISQSALRTAHFMAQILHESCNFTVLYENLNYSEVGLMKTWPHRFKPESPNDPAAFAHNPQKIADLVYGGRMGNTAPNDGFTFRGRGFLQLTGRANYQQISALLKAAFPDAPDLVATPDQAIGADWCLKVAAAKWQALGCNALADADNLKGVTKAVNGGLIGLPERQDCLEKTKAVWH